MVVDMLTKKSENNDPEHVKCSQARNQKSDNRDQVMAGQTSERKRPRENLVLAQEARRKRHAADRECVNEKRHEGDGYFRPQPTHISDVLRIGMMVTLMV